MKKKTKTKASADASQQPRRQKKATAKTGRRQSYGEDTRQLALYVPKSVFRDLERDRKRCALEAGPLLAGSRSSHGAAVLWHYLICREQNSELSWEAFWSKVRKATR